MVSSDNQTSNQAAHDRIEGVCMLQSTSTFRACSTNPDCRIVVDSCGCLSAEEARELGVDVIEFPFIMQDGEHRDDQWESMSSKEFYDRMRGGERVTTSAVSTGEFLDVFEKCAQEGIPTVYLSFTAGLSSSVRDAQAAASMVLSNHPGFTLEVIDNRMPCLTAGMLTGEVCRKRDAGATFDEIVDYAKNAPDCVHGYFTLDSLKWLAAGGRIPKAAAGISSLLEVKANLTYDLDGALTLTGISRGRKKALKNLIEKFEQYYVGGTTMPIGISDADCPEDAALVEELVRKSLAARGDSAFTIKHYTVDPTIGSHVGPGMIALAFWGIDRRSPSYNGGKR
jgi:DegV family protein with EDD domain